MPLDPDFRSYLDLAAADPNAPPLASLSPDQVRDRLRNTARAFALRPPATDPVRDLTIETASGRLPARLYAPLDATEGPLPGIVFFHGGGWVAGDLDTHDALCRTLASVTGARLVAVDYRLAPEHRFPAAVLDAIAALEWVAHHGNDLGIDPQHLAVAGDSAGGNLAAVAAIDARAHGRVLKAQLLIYPVTDINTETGSYQELATGYGLQRDDMRWFIDHYAPDRGDPRAAPLHHADLSGLPPAIVVIAGRDVLRDDGRLYAEALKRAGNDVTVLEYEGLIHGFANLTAVSETARQAVDEAAAILGEHLRVV